jgi:hypothetical protein
VSRGSKGSRGRGWASSKGGTSYSQHRSDHTYLQKAPVAYSAVLSPPSPSSAAPTRHERLVDICCRSIQTPPIVLIIVKHLLLVQLDVVSFVELFQKLQDRVLDRST